MSIESLMSAVRTEAGKRPELYRLPRVVEVTGQGKSWLYNAIKNKTFPAPVRCGPRNVAWVADEVHAWVEQQIRAADAAGRVGK